MVWPALTGISTAAHTWIERGIKCVKGKVGRAPPERRRGAHLPFKAIEPVGG